MSRVKAVMSSRYAGAAALLIRLILGAIFIYSGIAKIISASEFADAVANYRILPTAAVNLFALTLPWVEMLCGLFLINGIRLKSSTLLIAMLNLMFITAAISGLARGLDIECGCRTLASDKVGWELIAKDFVLVLLCVPVYFRASLHPPKRSNC